MYYFNTNGLSSTTALLPRKFVVCGKSLKCSRRTFQIIQYPFAKTRDSGKRFYFLTGDCHLAQVMWVFQAEGI